MFISKRYILFKITLFSALTLPSGLEGLPMPMAPLAERAHVALSESLMKLAEYERSRHAGWLAPGDYAASLRKDVIPAIAISAIDLQRTGAFANAKIFARKQQEFEAVALIYEAKDQLLRAESRMRKRQFAEASIELDGYWIGVRPEIEERLQIIDGVFPEAGTAMRTDLERLNAAALQLELILAERHLSLLKIAAFSGQRKPAAEAEQEWLSTGLIVRAQLDRLEYVQRIFPSEKLAPLATRFAKIDRLFAK